MSRGWTTCAQGHRHWGPYGAAGPLIRCGYSYLLRRRAWHVHNGGTWSTPGGARNLGEPRLTAALREAAEEMGELPPLTLSHLITNDHCGWSYITAVVDVAEPFTPRRNREGAEHAWLAPTRRRTARRG